LSARSETHPRGESPWPPGILPRGPEWLDRALNRPRIYIPFVFDDLVNVLGGVENNVLELDLLTHCNGLRLFLLNAPFDGNGPLHFRFFRGHSLIDETSRVRLLGDQTVNLYTVYEAGDRLDFRIASDALIGQDTLLGIRIEGWYF
jgi:hypothetical protein